MNCPSQVTLQRSKRELFNFCAFLVNFYAEVMMRKTLDGVHEGLKIEWN